MDYRVVGNRCAVDLDALQLPVSHDVALGILQRKGFRVVTADLIILARQCVGVAQYRRGARLHEAPQVFDCSSLIKWLYGQRGIWLPRRSIQQRRYGMAVGAAEIVAGDVIFTSGCIDYYDEDPADGVGHVGIATGYGSVIHAANRQLGVVENSLTDFVDGSILRGIRRYVSVGGCVVTLQVPAGREVEIADDIRWIILQAL